MPLSALITLVLGIVHRKKFNELQIMVIYPLASLIQTGIFHFWLLAANESWRVGRISISLFILIEFIIFLRFFDGIIILEKFKKYTKIIATIFILYVILTWLFTNAFYKHPSRLYLPQSLCILFFCFLYFLQIFRLSPELHLLNSPSFWITIGCLFYFSCTIPLFFAYEVLDISPSYYRLSSINYLAYTILFLFISKAFLCNPVPTK